MILSGSVRNKSRGALGSGPFSSAAMRIRAKYTAPHSYNNTGTGTVELRYMYMYVRVLITLQLSRCNRRRLVLSLPISDVKRYTTSRTFTIYHCTNAWYILFYRLQNSRSFTIYHCTKASHIPFNRIYITDPKKCQSAIFLQFRPVSAPTYGGLIDTKSVNQPAVDFNW